MGITDETSGESEHEEKRAIELGMAADRYWGEIAIHFAEGPALLLSIGERERSRLARQLRTSSKFFHIFARANQMVAVRRSAVTDVCLADDDCDTFGPEHDSYSGDGLWQVTESPDFWRIAGNLLRAADLQEIEEQFGKEEVAAVARTIGLNMPDDIDGLIEAGRVAAEKREPVLADAARALQTTERLTCQITWQLSAGKIRRRECGEKMDLSRFRWIEEARDPRTPGQMIIVKDPDDQMSFISVNALDYISLPRQLYFAWKERVSGQEPPYPRR
jgi:hypothetical protein